jgi:hypothetical protein
LIVKWQQREAISVVKRPLPDGPCEESHRGADQYRANENQ